MRTLTLLRGLDPKRKGIVLLFLREAGLIGVAGIVFKRSIIYLNRADLTPTQLTSAHLSEVNLMGVSLREANLNSSNLIGANLSEADLSGAHFERS